MSEKIVSLKVYFLIFGTLMVLTATTTWVAFYDLGRINTVVALVIAVTKALLVALFFMHVKYSSRLTRIAVVSGLLWLVIMIGLTMSDYLTRGWLKQISG